MDTTELKAALESDEGKALLKEMGLEDAKGLKAKNEELLASNKKLKDDMKSFQDQLDDIKAERDQAANEAASKKGDFETLKKNLEEKHAKELKRISDERNGFKGQVEGLLIDGGITDALTAANVAPQYLEDARIILKAKHKFELGDEGPTVGVKTIKDFIAEWSQGEHGRNYIAAEDNSGGDTKAKGRTDPSKAGAKKKSEMDHKTKADFINTNGKEAYDALPA